VLGMEGRMPRLGASEPMRGGDRAAGGHPGSGASVVTRAAISCHVIVTGWTRWVLTRPCGLAGRGLPGSGSRRSMPGTVAPLDVSAEGGASPS
jgi:hypothetical protein